MLLLFGLVSPLSNIITRQALPGAGLDRRYAYRNGYSCGLIAGGIRSGFRCLNRKRNIASGSLPSSFD